MLQRIETFTLPTRVRKALETTVFMTGVVAFSTALTATFL